MAFGNRILKQMNLFVPVYVACGGEELDGIDYVLATKIFRKFESLNLAMLREELKELCTYMLPRDINSSDLAALSSRITRDLKGATA